MGRAATAGRNLWTPSLQGARKPGRSGRSNRELGGEQVEGRQAVRELLAAGRREVREIWMTEGSDPSPILGEIDALARQAHVPVRLVSQRRLESIQGTEAPQGVVAFADPLEAVSLEDLVFGVRDTSLPAWPAITLRDATAAEQEDASEEEPLTAADGSGDTRADTGELGSTGDEERPQSGEGEGEGGAVQPDEPPADEPHPGEPQPDEPQAAAAPVAEPCGEGARRVPDSRPPVKAGAFLVLVDGVTDPQNLGAILRSAECAGATGVVIPRHRAAHVTPAVTKAAAGAVEYLPMALVAGIPSALQALEELGVLTVGLDERGSTPLFELDAGLRPVALVLGAEGRGLAPLARRRCEVVAKIEMGGHIPSLNVSTAAAVACFEVARQRAAARPA